MHACMRKIYVDMMVREGCQKLDLASETLARRFGRLALDGLERN